MGSKKILVAGPFVGELGFECFSWQPLVRKKFLTGGFTKCHVYTNSGSELLYPFAKVHKYEPEKPYQSEGNCLFTRPINPDSKEYKGMVKRLQKMAIKKWPGAEFVSTLGLGHCKAHYELGSPNRIVADREFPGVEKSKKKTIVFCLRGRRLSKFRNWSNENWYKLSQTAVDNGCRAIIVGTSKKDIPMPDGVINLINKTTLDDVIRIFGVADLAVGGSTGTMHLASRCGVDHLVWATRNEMSRYKKTNWAGAKHCVYPWGWDPRPSKVSRALKGWISSGKFLKL